MKYAVVDYDCIVTESKVNIAFMPNGRGEIVLTRDIAILNNDK